MNKDPYYDRPEISNSDLSWLKNTLTGQVDRPINMQALNFGNLVDAIITEISQVDFLNYRAQGIQFDRDDFQKAKAMIKELRKSSIAPIVFGARYQSIFIKQLQIVHEGHRFVLPVRCKYDFINGNIGGDLKTTSAHDRHSFMNAIDKWDIDRQRAFYMDISGLNRDVIVGMSKKTHEVYIVPIRRGDNLYERGKNKYQYLAYEWYHRFGTAQVKRESLLT